MALLLNRDIGCGIIPMKELKDGQMAEMMESDYRGQIVQRVKDSVFTLGSYHGKSWTCVSTNTLKVRVLRDGEVLVVSDNT